ncbi:hypothetical protein EON78_06215 [bacterium]|nr:MAG: hypothetical protein EON78_06215 [bacterium]
MLYNVADLNDPIKKLSELVLQASVDLEKAVKLDHSFKNMLKVDKDFSSIHDYQKFKSLIT